jgi:hypothetical protein
LGWDQFSDTIPSFDWLTHSPNSHSDVFIFSFLDVVVHEKSIRLSIEMRNNGRILMNLIVIETNTILVKRYELAQMEAASFLFFSIVRFFHNS